MDKALELINLAKQYFNICNAGLTHRRNEPVFGALIEALSRLKSGETINLKLVDARGASVGCFSTRFVDAQFTPLISVEPSSEIRLVLDQSFLESVVSDAETYIQHPERLDWSWLRQP